MAKKQAYKVLVGLNHGDRRAEPGEVVDWIPPASVTWLLESGIIAEAPEGGDA